jgi:hypothetical protein
VNRANWILLAIGVLVSFGVYRKKISEPSMKVRVWGDLKGTLVDIYKQPEYVRANRQLEAYKVTLIIALLILVVSITNWQFNFVSGPVLLFFSGSALVFSYYLRAKIPSEVQLKIGVENDIRVKLERNLGEIKKGAIIALAIVVAVSGNWEYRIQRDMSEQKELAINEALDLSGSGWCSNFWDIDTQYYPEVEPIKTGGWPCIKVGSVSDITFVKKPTHLEICFDYSLSRSDGRPSDESYYEYDYQRMCVTDSWDVRDGGWSTDTFESKIYSSIKDDLDLLQTTSCRRLFFLLTEEERIVYC